MSYSHVNGLYDTTFNGWTCTPNMYKLYGCVFEDVSWTEYVFARSNHDDDDADGDGDTPPRESYRNTHSQTVPNTTGTFTWKEIFNLPPYMHIYADDAMHTTWQWRWKNFWQMNFRQRVAIIILQEIEQFASLMVFDLDNQASSVNNIYVSYGEYEKVSINENENECTSVSMEIESCHHASAHKNTHKHVWVEVNLTGNNLETCP